jgi:tetratricopeptide (TPR) repeat protein
LTKWQSADGSKVLEKVKRRDMALVQYDEACELDPRSTKARFAKARVLLVLHRPKEAFIELDLLKNMEPDDAKVHYLLGRVYKALGERTAALRHFTIAMNLDPKVRLASCIPLWHVLIAGRQPTISKSLWRRWKRAMMTWMPMIWTNDIFLQVSGSGFRSSFELGLHSRGVGL